MILQPNFSGVASDYFFRVTCIYHFLLIGPDKSS